MRNAVRICFFLSGASGLVFELLWTRMLSLVFGSTTLAISTVLTAFMGGLGLGSYWAGRHADKLRDPVKAYALAEAGIGIWALFVPWVISHYTPLNQWLWATFGDHYGWLSLLRFAAAAALLLLPTTLMGATLPLLARVVVDRPGALREVGGNLGGLYALNLFGALAGSFFAGFVLMPTVGLAHTNRIAASVNLMLAVGIWILQHRLHDDAPPDLDDWAATVDAESLAPRRQAAGQISRAARRVVLVGFAASGATAMIVQVLWTRALAVLIGSSIYSFTLILLAFLAGLGAGSAWLGRWADRTALPVRSLGWVHLLTVLAMGSSYLLMDRLPFVFAWLLASTSFGPGAVQICQFVLACLVILPATLLMGAVFPLTMRIATASLEAVGHDVGRTYAINTLGAIVGSFLSGFVVLPLLGLERGLFLAAATLTLLAAALFWVAPGGSRRLPLAAAGLVLVVAPWLPRWNLTSFSQGFFRVSIARDYVSRKAAKKEWKRPEMVFYEDGVATTVTVERWGKSYSLKNNGKVDASSDSDMPTQVAVGLLPLLLHPGASPPRVALIGFGSGVTSGSVTQAPLESLEVVELEPAIYRASKFFEHVNHRPLDNPKVKARVGDGRNFLGQRTDLFDVIISQPSNPWITGVSNLFTREYFALVKRRLAKGGVFCQWAQLYEMAPWNVKSIYRTLASEFPYVTVFSAEDLSSDTILIASNEPLPLDVERLRARFAHPALAAEAARAGWRTPYDLLGQVLLTPDEVAPFTAGAAINTDDNALIEFAAPRDLLGYSSFDPYLTRVYGAAWPYGHLRGWVRGVATDPGGPGAGEAQLARALLANGRVREAEFWTRKAEVRAPDSQTSRKARQRMELIATRFGSDPEIPLAPGGDLNPPVVPPSLSEAKARQIEREYREVEALFARRKFVSAYKALEDWPAEIWQAPSPDFALLAGFLHYKAEFYEDAVGLLKPLAEDEAYVQRRPETLYYLARARFARGDHGRAMAAFDRFVDLQEARGRPALPSTPPAGSALPLAPKTSALTQP
ncbi:MAG: fused MFS/spermidine synthase [Myxococcales bacterium]|nr:fused MFS/spermidine synthase [Myxococcales bacterium]